MTHISFTSSSQNLTFGDSLLADEKLIYVVKRNVFGFFSLKEYDTPLKRKVFSETEEYKQKMRALDSLSKRKYYYPYSSIHTYEKLENQLEYNIHSKSFNIILDVNQWQREAYFSSPPKSIRIGSTSTVVWFKTLPTTKKYDPAPCYFENISISTDEKTGLEIENNKDSIELVFVFPLLGLENNRYKYFNLYERRAEDIGWECIVAPKVKILIVNKSNKKVYFSMTY